jgi:hypothetical protein
MPRPRFPDFYNQKRNTTQFYSPFSGKSQTRAPSHLISASYHEGSHHLEGYRALTYVYVTSLSTYKVQGPVAKIVDSPIPEPDANQVLILVSGSNPKDWKTPEFTGSERDEGDNIAGIVEKVGTNVAEFKPATG